MREKDNISVNFGEQLFLNVFEQSTSSIIIKTDAPCYTIVAASDEFLRNFFVDRDEIIGKYFFDIFPANNISEASILQQSFNEVIQSKKKTDIAAYPYHVPLDGQNFYWAATNVPIFDDSGVSHIIHTPVNITELIVSKQQEAAKLLNLQIQQGRMNELFMKAPVGVTFLNRDNFVIEYANHAICEMWNRGGPEIVTGKPAFEVAVEVAEFRKVMEKVVRTGVPFIASDAPVLLNRNNTVDTFYFDLIFDPLRDADNHVTGIIGIAVEVTEKVKARQLLLDSEQRFRNLIGDAPVAISVLKGYDMVVESANRMMLEVWGKPAGVVGLPIAYALPELKGQPFIELLQTVYATGAAYYGYEAKVILNRKGKDETCYFNFVYQPLNEADDHVTGVMVVATEVTEQIIAKYTLEETERQFRNLVTRSPIAMGLLRGEDMVIELYNAPLLKIWGKQPAEVNKKKLIDVFPELAGQPFPDILANVYHTGTPYSDNEVAVYIATVDDLVKYYLDITYEPLFTLENKVSGIMVTAVNVTENVEARHKLEDAEERLRLATDSTGLGTWDLDLKEGTVIYSPQLAEIFGRPSDAILNHHDLRNAVHPDDIQLVIRSFEKALKSGKYFYEARIVWPDGTIHWVRTTGRVVYNDKHEPLRMLGTVNDVTTQRNLIDELKESEENLRLATQAAELGTFDMDLLKGTMDWDARCRELFGIYSSRPVTYEHDFLPGLHPDDRERITNAIELLTNKRLSNGDYDVEYRTIGAEDNKLRWVKAKGKMLFDESNSPVRFMGAVLDITESKQDEIRKNDFIAMASHELKTPLTSLKAYIQLLLTKARKSGDEFMISSLQKSENQINKMTTLIYGFLDLSKIEGGKLQLNMQLFNINDLIDEAIADSSPIAPGHTIVFEHAGPVMVNADKEKINQVLVNFISNAVKYSPKRSKIIITSAAEGKAVRVSVKDEGIGVDAKHQQHIFQRFYRVEDESTKGFSGFGIGLYISAEIIELHKGKIGVKSKEDNGASFYFTLPVA